MLRFPDPLSFSKAEYYQFSPIPLPVAFKDATGGFGEFAPLRGWLRVYDDEGYYGETFCSENITETILPLVLTGKTKSHNDWYTELYWKRRSYGFHNRHIADLGQFDFIMLEILARRAGMPLHRFLGAQKDWAAIYKTGGAITLNDEALVAQMARYADEGYTTLKFKVGSDWGKNMRRDARRIQKVRKAVGDNIAIAIDANQVWDVNSALQFADMIREYDIAWFEEPVDANDMNAIRALKDNNIGIPLGFGESMQNYHAFETYVEKGVDHLIPLVGRINAMGDLLKIRHLSKQNGLQFSSGGMVYTNVAFGSLYDEDEMLEYNEPVFQTVGQFLEIKPEEKEGRMHIPDITGSPIRLNFNKLEKCGYLEFKQYYSGESHKKQFAAWA